VFDYKPGDEKAALARIAEQVRDEMKAQSPNKNALFEPA
jgi:hypothetical protein